MSTVQLTGPQNRIDALFRAHRDEVYRSLLRDLGSHADAEDGTQAVFLNAFRSLERGCRPQAARAWLLAIAKNVARRTWRERARATAPLDLEEAAAPATDEARRELLAGLAALPAAQRQVLLLHELYGMQHEEISQATGQSVAATETCLFRARRALRASIRQEGALAHETAAKLIPRFVSGKLTRQEREGLQAHLADCPECATTEARLRAPKLRRKLLGWLLWLPPAIQRLIGLITTSPATALGAAGACVAVLAGAATHGFAPAPEAKLPPPPAAPTPARASVHPTARPADRLVAPTPSAPTPHPAMTARASDHDLARPGHSGKRQQEVVEPGQEPRPQATEDAPPPSAPDESKHAPTAISNPTSNGPLPVAISARVADTLNPVADRVRSNLASTVQTARHTKNAAQPVLTSTAPETTEHLNALPAPSGLTDPLEAAPPSLTDTPTAPPPAALPIPLNR